MSFLQYQGKGKCHCDDNNNIVTHGIQADLGMNGAPIHTADGVVVAVHFGEAGNGCLMFWAELI